MPIDTIPTRNKMPINKNAPFKTVVFCKVETFEMLPTGEVTNQPVIKDNFILNITGKDYKECKEKTQKVLAYIKSLPNR